MVNLTSAFNQSREQEAKLDYNRFPQQTEAKGVKLHPSHIDCVPVTWGFISPHLLAALRFRTD